MQDLKPVVIFGVRDTAELAHFYLTHDSDREVVAFTVHERYLEKGSFRGLPVVPFEKVHIYYPPSQFDFFAPMTARRMNLDREKIYNDAKNLGYKMISYISSKATVFPDIEIGDNCFILENNTIQPFTKIGNNVVLWSGNHIGHHGLIEDHVFFTSHVVMSGHCHIRSYCFFGVNSAIRDFSELKQGTLLGMGASLTKQETEEWSVYLGNPAKKLDGKLSKNLI
jgi:sugar O-acyltransferase (sialic acid O-acetyltransferase NeuD family)